MGHLTTVAENRPAVVSLLHDGRRVPKTGLLPMTPLEDAVATVRASGRGTLLDPAGRVSRQLARLPALTTLRAVLAWTTIVPVQLGPVHEVGAAVLTVQMVHGRLNRS